MKRGGHVPSEPGLRRQNPRPYGATGPVFNAMRHASSPHFRGEGRVERHSAAGCILAAATLYLAIVAAPATAHVPVILDFGDSLTAGYGLATEQAFPARLEVALRRQGTEVRVVNGGVY